MFPIFCFDLVAIGIRFWLSYFRSETFGQRVEINTPLNSWKRLQEGLALYESGISPYEGDTCHTPPLMLFMFFYLNKLWSSLSVWLFPICDIIASYCISIGIRSFIHLEILKQEKNKDKYAKDVDKILFTKENLIKLPLIVKLCYLFNPFSIASCVGQTTTTLNNAILAGSFLFMMKGQKLPCLCLLAFATYFDMYPIMLIIPAALYFAKVRSGGSIKCFESLSTSKFCRSFVADIFLSIILIGILFYSSYFLTDSWQFLGNTYGFIISATDLTPNVGLFWYFFTEMFDPFRLFFLWVFILNPFVYVVPLTLCLRDEPVLLFHQLLMIMTIFKSYPSVGDAAVYLSLLPMWTPLYKYIRHGFVVGCAVVAFSVLAPVMWYLWIETGSANANFYFAITLVYSTAQIFLLTDVLYAYLRRRVHLKHGLKPMINEKEAKVVLE